MCPSVFSLLHFAFVVSPSQKCPQYGKQLSTSCYRQTVTLPCMLLQSAAAPLKRPKYNSHMLEKYTFSKTNIPCGTYLSTFTLLHFKVPVLYLGIFIFNLSPTYIYTYIYVYENKVNSFMKFKRSIQILSLATVSYICTTPYPSMVEQHM